MKNTLKEKLEMAYNAGIESVSKNKEIDNLLDEGTKKCPERPSFNNWLDTQNAIKPVEQPVFESVMDCK